MNFAFSDDQEMVRDAARRLLSERSTMERVHQIMDDPTAYHDQPLWEQMAENGWIGLAVPEEYGGSGLGYLEACVVAEEVGRALACVPLASSSYLVTEALLLMGSEEQKKRYLPELASGQMIGALAVAEGGRLDPQGIRLKSQKDKLTGTKDPVTDALCADVMLVAARTSEGSDGISLFLVKKADEHVKCQALQVMDQTKPLAKVAFDGAPGELLGPAGAGWALIQQLFDRAAVLLAFEQLGGGDHALQMAVAYAKERYVFGRPLGSFQAIKHRLADMFTKLELARSNCYYGAWALSKNAPELGVAACLARVAAGDAFEFASQENVQIHGGIGFTWQADPHMFVKRARHLEYQLGDRRLWRDRLITKLGYPKAG